MWRVHITLPTPRNIIYEDIGTPLCSHHTRTVRDISITNACGRWLSGSLHQPEHLLVPPRDLLVLLKGVRIFWDVRDELDDCLHLLWDIVVVSVGLYLSVHSDDEVSCAVR